MFDMVEGEGKKRSLRSVRNAREEYGGVRVLEDEESETIATILNKLSALQYQIGNRDEELPITPEELQRVYELFRNVYDNAPAGYFILRAGDNTVIEANNTTKELLHLKRARITNSKFSDFIAPEYLDDFYLRSRKALEGSGRKKCEVKVLRGDGSTFWARLEITSLLEKQQLLVAMLDISRMKDAESQLEEYRRQLGKRGESVKITGELSKRLLLAQDEERRRLGRELHNGVGQSLTLLVMSASQLRKIPPAEIGPALDELEIIVGEVVQQVRSLSRNMSMHMLEDTGLEQALDNYFKEIRSRTGLQVNFNSQQLPRELPGHIEATLYLIIRESIKNVVRHARTDRADVSIEVTKGTVNLRIEDKGIGFDPASVDVNSMGVKLMRERANILGAKLTITSSPGNGTLITGEFPLT